MSDKSLLFGSFTRSSEPRRPRIHPYNLPMNAGRRQVSTAATTASPDSKRISAAGWRIVLLASLGGSLEFYDFVIFGIFAKDIADAIFPNPTPLISLMASFAAFAAGYLARPIGGIFLSHFGDRYGRRPVFLISIFVMSGATLGMGLVPSFATWGAAASVLMVVLRLVQGFCLGGELPGVVDAHEGRAGTAFRSRQAGRRVRTARDGPGCPGRRKDRAQSTVKGGDGTVERATGLHNLRPLL